jgi:large repetitive protein
LSATYGSAVTVPYTVGGTATAGAGADYTIPASPLVIPAGQGSGAITITVNGDGLDELDETVIVTMGTPVNATPGATTVHTATIVDDDAAPTVAFTVAAQSNLESVSPVTATVQLSAASGQAVTVPYTVDAASTATGGGTDYSLGTASPLSIAAGTTTATISLSVIGDGVVEPDETVLLVLGGPTNATLGAIPNQTITIQNDDAAPPAPVITSPTGGSLTNDNTPTITGTAQTGTTVEVFDGVASLGTTAAAGGTWSLTPAPLADGSHTVTAQATDGAGNTGSLSAGVTFTVDATVPAAPVILSPTQNEALLTATPTVTGTAEAAATVAVLIDGAVSGTTAADGAGAWSYTVPAALATGPHTVRARATDAAGNTGPDSGTTDFTVP